MAAAVVVVVGGGGWRKEYLFLLYMEKAGCGQSWRETWNIHLFDRSSGDVIILYDAELKMYLFLVISSVKSLCSCL